MVVISGLLGEKEINAMTDDELVLLGNVLDDKLAVMLLNYIKSEDGNKETQERLMRVLGDKINKLTFHLEVIESGVLEDINKLAVPSLASADWDLDVLINELEFIVNNNSKLKVNIEPRDKASFKEFEKMIKELNIRMASMEREFDRLPDRLAANKKSFYSNTEKKRATGVGRLVFRAQELVIALFGAKYLKICNDKDTPEWIRRAF